MVKNRRNAGGDSHPCEFKGGFSRIRRFTLIELLIVIAIIGILASMLLPSLMRVRKKAQRTLELTDRKQIGTATQMYADDYEGVYPTPFDYGIFQSHVHFLMCKTFGNGMDLRSALFDDYIGGGATTFNQFFFCQSDLLKARYPGYNTMYGYEGLDANWNLSTLAYYVTPTLSGVPSWGPVGSWQCDSFDTTSVRSADPELPMWSCLIRETNSGAKWIAHDAPNDATLPAGANTVYFDGAGEWVTPRDFVRLVKVSAASNNYYWIPNRNGAVKGSTYTWLY